MENINTMNVPPTPQKGYTCYYDRTDHRWVVVKKSTN